MKKSAKQSAGGNSKETLAVIRNLKEARVLEKSLQTLSLEESYAAKLLDLDAKMVKFKFGRLKKNVNKIKSHLQAEDISQMQRLEQEGRFVHEHPMICTSSSSTKIAAAEKRLKLSRYRRVQSAMPALYSRSGSSISSNSTSDNASDSRSMTKIYEDPKFQCKHKLRPKTTTACSSNNKTPEEERETVHEKQCRVISARDATTTALLLERVAKAQKEVKESAPAGIYSSHEEKNQEEEIYGRVERDAQESFGSNQYEERRKRLIEVESQILENLGDKRLGFVQHIEGLKQMNPHQNRVEPELTQRVIQSIDSMAPRSGELISTGTDRKSQLVQLSKSGCPITDCKKFRT